MQIPDRKLSDILISIGVHIGPDRLQYPSKSVTQYISEEYLTSERHETDEAYRMFEGNLLHIDSGLRITYTSAEDYYGEHVDYKVIELFVLNEDGRHLAVNDVDFVKRVIVTPEGLIHFSATSKSDRKKLERPQKDDSAGSDESFIDQIRNSPNRMDSAKMLLNFLKSQNRRGSRSRKIELLEKLIAEIEAEEAK